MLTLQSGSLVVWLGFVLFTITIGFLLVSRIMAGRTANGLKQRLVTAAVRQWNKKW